MGSLMAGWKSPLRKSESVSRSTSLTKEEIESFKKMKKKIEQDHLEAISKLVNNITEDPELSEETMFKRSHSLPVTPIPSDDPTKKHGWWRRSNLAFLNEPAVAEGRPRSYAARFDAKSRH